MINRIKEHLLESNKKFSKNKGNNSFTTYKKHKVVCLACEKKLSNLESMVAGMGPICRERTGFASLLSRDHLSCMEGNPEPIEKIKKTKTGILRVVDEDKPYFGTLLSNEKGNDQFFFDKNDIFNNVEKGFSLTESYIKSLKKSNKKDLISLSSLSLPQNPQIRKEYKKYQKKFREHSKRLDDLKVEDTSLFKEVNQTKELTDDQKDARNNLVLEKKRNPEEYSLFMKKGVYHRLTLIARLNESSLTEADLLSNALLEKHEINTLYGFAPIEDYGLTDSEISNGFLHSNQHWERNLFKAFKSGNNQLDKLILLYRHLEDFSFEEKITAKKIARKILVDEDQSEAISNLIQ